MVGVVVAKQVDGQTVIAEAHATSPLRFVQARFPQTKRSAAICLVTFGGGLVDGDRIETEVRVDEGATLLVFTQSTTKVFRGAASQSIRARVAGTLVLLPDPVAAFKEATYTQRIDVELLQGGRCLILDGFTSGRAAFGERWAMRRLDLRTTVRRDRVLANDALLLDQADGSIAERTRFDAFLTLLSIGLDVPRMEEAPPTADLAIASSALPRVDGHITRVAASSPAGAMAAVRSRLRNLPDIDVADPFEARY